jgi:hypothetical protein
MYQSKHPTNSFILIEELKILYHPLKKYSNKDNGNNDNKTNNNSNVDAYLTIMLLG